MHVIRSMFDTSWLLFKHPVCHLRNTPRKCKNCFKIQGDGDEFEPNLGMEADAL